MKRPVLHRVLRFQDTWVDCAFSQAARAGNGDLVLDGGAASGTVTVHALDAGEGSSFRRVVVEAEASASTRARLEIFVSDAREPPALSFIQAPGLDCWLPSLFGELPDDDDAPGAERYRFVWLRITLETLDVAESPRVRQIRAQTRGEGYLAELPAFYAAEDAKNGHFLEHLLEAWGAGFGETDRQISDLARRLDPLFARPEDLAWLAEWLGWTELPALPTEQLRRFIDGLFELGQRRGTLQGLAALVTAFLGLEVRIVEHFQQRATWILGASELGIETGVTFPADGWVVPGSVCASQATEPAPLVVGDARVGEQGPLAADELGSPLFDEDAHRFTVFVPPGAVSDGAQLRRLRALIDREKPAHTDYHLCVVCGMVLGQGTRLGVNAFIGDAHAPRGLGATTLGVDTTLVSRPGSIKLGENDRIFDTTFDRGHP